MSTDGRSPLPTSPQWKPEGAPSSAPCPGAAPSWTVWQGSSWSRFWSPAKQAPLRAVELGRREYLASTYTKHFQYITHLGGPVERELSLLRLIENLSPSTLRASAMYFDRVGNKEQV